MSRKLHFRWRRPLPGSRSQNPNMSRSKDKIMANSLILNRRTALAGIIGSVAALGTPAILRAAPAARLALYGPPAGPTITLAHAIFNGGVGQFGG